MSVDMLRKCWCFRSLLRVWHHLDLHLICIFACAKTRPSPVWFGGRPYLSVYSLKAANEWLLTLQKFIIRSHWLKDEWTYYALKRHVKSLARRDSSLISPPADKRQHGGETGQRWRRGWRRRQQWRRGIDGEVEREGGREEGCKTGGTGGGRWEPERWRL